MNFKAKGADLFQILLRTMSDLDLHYLYMSDQGILYWHAHCCKKKKEIKKKEIKHMYNLCNLPQTEYKSIQKHLENINKSLAISFS